MNEYIMLGFDAIRPSFTAWVNLSVITSCRKIESVSFVLLKATKWNVLLHFSLENINTYFCSSNLAPLRVCCMCAVCEPSLRLYHKTDTGQITEMPIWPSLYENLCCDSQNQSLCLSVSLYRLKKIISPLRLRSSSCLMLLWGSFTVYYGEPKRREGWTWNNVFKRWFELIQ